MYKQPGLAVDIIIVVDSKIILIKRKNPPYGWALTGGFVELGETVENTAIRESKEETGLDLVNLRQFHVYSDPKRDPRGHTISVVFIAKGIGIPKAADDAADIKIYAMDDLPEELAFDHRQILEDYRKELIG